MNEFNIQRFFVKWLQEEHPLVWDLSFAVPNGAQMGPRGWHNMKSIGAKKGVWDIVMLYPVGIWHGAIIEVKSEKGSLTLEQKAFAKYFGKYYFTIVGHSLEELKSKTERYITNGY